MRSLPVILFFLLPFLTPAQNKSTKSFTIAPRSRLCPKKIGGDREFNGHGPNVSASARLRIGGPHGRTRIFLDLFMNAKEDRHDWTEAQYRRTGQLVYEVPKDSQGKHAFKITRIKSATFTNAFYKDTDHNLDILDKRRRENRARFSGDLVKRFEIMGDTGGNDIGNCTRDDVYMNVIFNPVQIEIQSLEKIVSAFPATRIHPNRLVNKMSRDIYGLTQDHGHWYFTQGNHLLKVPLSQDLATFGTLNPPGTTQIEIPNLLARRGYERFGDLDHYRGYIFVALQGDGRVKSRPVIAVFNSSTMQLETTFSMKRWQKSIGFCAINPSDGWLYTSESVNSSKFAKFQIRITGDKITIKPGPSTLIKDQQGKPLVINEVRSGTFSKTGRYLFLVNGAGRAAPANLRNRGVWSFNHRTGRLMRKKIIGGSTGQKIGGITYGDVAGKAPGIDNGPLHLIIRHLAENGSREAYTMQHISYRENYDWSN